MTNVILPNQLKVGTIVFALNDNERYESTLFNGLDESYKNLIKMGATHINDKPEPPHEHKWLYNKWRTEYLTQCALDTLCNPHEFEPKLDTRFKYHVCQKCGIVISDAEKKAEFYQCKSYYDNNNQLQDCTCGKCGKKIEMPDITAVGDLSSVSRVTIPMRQWMLDVTNWINSQEKNHD